MGATLIWHESKSTFHDFEETSEPCTISELKSEHESEVLDFLSARPIHTVFMASLVRDNGLVSPENRGSFYACRDRSGRLEGVGLIGQITLIEARTDASLSAFARMARYCPNTHLIRGERKTIDRFWKGYASDGQDPRLISRELLFEQREPLRLTEPTVEIQPATLIHLDQVMKVNAAMAFQECGISPLQRDPNGFRQRTIRRIKQNRVWVWVKEQTLIFKADIVADTPQAVYLEGVHVHQDERRKGYGLRCLGQLSSILLARTESICLTINQRNKKTLGFYAKAGYQFRSSYKTIYLNKNV